MQQLAAPVTRPRLHLIRIHQVLTPNAKLRALVVRQGPEVAGRATEAAAANKDGAQTVQGRRTASVAARRRPGRA
jgi:hypothetical protein